MISLSLVSNHRFCQECLEDVHKVHKKGLFESIREILSLLYLKGQILERKLIEISTFYVLPSS